MRQDPFIVDIKRHSLEDGPGIRSVVFFKGCPLRCSFCHNPETQDLDVEIAFTERECIRCGACADVCTRAAIDFDDPGRIDRARCDRCGKCADMCPGRGLRFIGTPYSVDALLEILLRDRAFYWHSGGGVTFSGGECTLFPDYLEALLQQLKAQDIHVALQTSGYFPYQTFEQKLLPYLDLIYYDVKIADPEFHRLHTGKSNQRIFANLERLLKETRADVHPRIPLIPGITSSRENLSALVDLLCQFGAQDVSLIPYNPMGLEMAVRLGKEKQSLPERFMNGEEEGQVISLFEEIRDRVGFSVPA